MGKETNQIILAEKSSICIIFDYRKMTPLNRFGFENCHKYDTSELNNDQLYVYNHLIAELTPIKRSVVAKAGPSATKVILLDAPPGTGKSFLITTLLRNMKYKHRLIVYRNSLVDEYMHHEVKSQTIYRFLKDSYKFYGVWGCNALFNDGGSLETSMLKAYRNIMEMKIKSDVLLLDEYTVISPWLLLCLVHAAKRLGKHLIIAGDGDQMSSMQPSQYHQESNRSLAIALSDASFSLQEQMRIKTKKFNQILAEMKMKLYQNMKTDMNIDYMYFVYERFKNKFFVNNSNSSLYVTGHRENLKKIQEEIVEQWKKEKSQIHYEYFQFSRSDEDSFDDYREYECSYDDHWENEDSAEECSDYEYSYRGFEDTIDFKGHHSDYPTNLPLVVGKTYLYENCYLVKLKAIKRKSLIVVNCNGKGETLQVHWRKLEDCGFNRDFVGWLKAESRAANSSSVTCYPLRVPLATYHSIQGRTINHSRIVFDMDDINANVFYMGLSRLPSAKLLAGIRTKMLTSLVYSELQNDDYYYKINMTMSKSHPSFKDISKEIAKMKIKNIAICKDINEFNDHKNHCKILKSFFNNNEIQDIHPTRGGILKVSNFFKSHDFLFHKSFENDKVLKYFRKFIYSQDNNHQDYEPQCKKSKNET
ncbi:uncharacterized protein LOC142226910 [Haematobia irritans]|uniref:uncharacterized protein LOC142226910 n=1 Tax=Haematobia irritans TaxID=7368 RepID=UPI003F506500